MLIKIVLIGTFLFPFVLNQATALLCYSGVNGTQFINGVINPIRQDLGSVPCMTNTNYCVTQVRGTLGKYSISNESAVELSTNVTILDWTTQ